MTSTRGGAPAGLACCSSRWDGLCLTSLRGMTGGVCTYTPSGRASIAKTGTCSSSYPSGPLPVMTLYSQACQGHITNSPRSRPSDSGPPLWLQVLPIARNRPSWKNRATDQRSSLTAEGTRERSSAVSPRRCQVVMGRFRWVRVDSSPYARSPLARRRHLLHRLDRSHRVRDHHPDPSLLRAAAGSGRAGAGCAARGVLGDAVRGDRVPGPHLRPGGTTPHPA